MKRKLLSVLLTVAMTATLLVGCGGSDAPAAAPAASDFPDTINLYVKEHLDFNGKEL